jgi:hypothetical protein
MIEIRYALSISAEKQQQPSLVVFKDFKILKKFYDEYN